MTALCGGGTSGPQPGLGLKLIVPAGLITAGLGLIDPLLLPFGVLLDGFVFDLVANCATDPPPCPTFDATDWQNLLATAGLIIPQATIDKLQALINRWLWFQYCQCTSVATPAYDCYPGQPAGATVPGVNPTTPGCVNGQWQGTLPENYPSLGNNSIVNLNGLLPGGPASILVTEIDGNQYPALAIPAGVTSLTVSMQTACASTQSIGGAEISTFCYDANGTGVGTDISLSACQPGTPDRLIQTVQIPATARYWRGRGLYLYPNLPYTPVAASAQAHAYCGGPGPTNPCAGCPSDPQITQILQLIWQLDQKIYAALGTTAQSWQDGVTHANLSQHGSIVLQGKATGIRVTMTTLPTGVQVDPGTPPFYWNAGFITPIELGSPLRGSRLVFTPQTFALPQFTDSIGYTLEHGTVISITELIPV